MAEDQNGQNPSFKPEEEMTEEERTALKADEDFILNFKEEDKDDPDKVAQLDKALKNAQTTIHQKRHYRDQSGKLKGEIETLKKTTPPTPPAKPEDTKKEVDSSVRLEFRQDHPELSKEVVKEIMDHAAAFGISPEEALKKPMMQKWIKDTQTSEDIDDASIVPGNTPGGALAEKDWSNASPAEMEKARNKILFPNG